MTSGPLLSVISVTYNDREGLEQTLGSLASFTGHDCEIIVVDGDRQGLHDELVARLSPVSSTYLTGPDAGIYDAMNKGLRAARGRWVWFLNGGDQATEDSSTSILQSLTSLRDDAVDLVLFGYYVSGGRRRLARDARPPSYIRHGLPSSHQAIMFKRSAIPRQGYDLSYRICGDYALTASVMAAGPAVVTRRERVVVFDLKGMSGGHSPRAIAAEAARVQRDILDVAAVGRLRSAIRHQVSWAVRKLVARATR